MSRPFISANPGLRAIRLVASCLAALHLVPSMGSIGPAAAVAQEAVVSGRLAPIWEDPLPERGTPRLRHFLATERGELIALRVTPDQLRVVGGELARAGSYVRVSGRWTERRPGPGAATDRVLTVGSIRFAAPPPGAFPEPAGAPIMGSYPWITVLCRFADMPTQEPHAVAWYEELMGSTEPGVDHYWRELSFDNANVAGSGAVGWYDLPHPRDYYVVNNSADLARLRRDCAAVADADVYFPDFEGINFQFNGSLGPFSWGGGSTLTIDGVSKFYSMTWLANWADHVTYTHEMGHGFGLPHSSGPYGATYDSKWDVMSGSWTDYDAEWGWLAPHTIAFHKEMLGWIPANRIYDAAVGTSQTLTLHRLADSGAGDSYLMVRLPIPGGAYYTVEARRDDVGYDVHLPSKAVIMHRVDGRAYVVDPDGDGDPNDEGAMWVPGETFTDPAAGVEMTVESEVEDGYVVTISLVEPGQIELDPAVLDFVADQGSDPASQTLSMTNSGTGGMDWTATTDASWLYVAPVAGITSAGETSELVVSVASTSLSPGSYRGAVTVDATATNSPQSVAVNLEVTPAPVIVIDTADLEFSAITGVDPAPQDLVLRNAGSAELTWTAGSDAGWLALGSSAGTLPAGEMTTVSVTVAVTGLDAGTYSATITVAGDATNSPQTLGVSLALSEAGSLDLSPTALVFTVWEGDDPEPGEFSITNDGAGALAWTASADSSWVSMSMTAGQLAPAASQPITVSVAAAGLAAGTRSASITVDGNVDDGPQSVAIDITVRARPELVADEVADHLLGVRIVLDPTDLEYLDHIGNRNGSFDVGDFRAWLQREGLLSGAAVRPPGEAAP